ncbi:MAG: hypothetical protein K6G33_03730 [Ruminococcus sp.]|uniref:ACT domain-containing protein n=1 Tax=Ruminococcus sp. TaxID=41978 RepID=UPI0015686FBA|nr:ACT domain-containing protein [Ruminococcus sp.]MCR5599841.1 hypothetical protein [Ruminococcus sp.]
MKRIEVISLDRIGLVGEISNVIRRLNGNIITHTANVVTDEKNTFVSHFTADIDFGTVSENEAVMRRLRRIKNVQQVRITDL